MGHNTCIIAQIFYVEVLTNPLVELGDLEAVVKFSQRHKLLSIIDSTFATPVLCRYTSLFPCSPLGLMRSLEHVTLQWLAVPHSHPSTSTA